MIADIQLIRSEVETSQFLGAIVAFELPRQTHIVGRMRALAIVDGQQRLLTLNIFIMAIVESLAKLDKDEALETVRAFLLLPNRRGLDVNTRIVPAFADRSQFRALWDRLSTPNALKDQFDDLQPHPPSPSGEAQGNLTTQYQRILKFLKNSMPDDDEEKILYLREILAIITRGLTFVHLILNDASAATKIFERLNFRGVRVGIVDLVRNEVFGEISENPQETQRIFDHVWNPFEERFEGNAEAFFFPYCLIQNSNVKKSELFSQLRETWDDLPPEGKVGHMRPYQIPFLCIDGKVRFPGSHEISSRIERLVRMGRPSSIYSFVMSMLHTNIRNEISDEQCVDMLDALESFLVRRAIVGFEPTGLHALFKGLWEQLVDYDSTGFKNIVAEKPTIQWPNDAELTEAISTRPLAKTKICSYLLVEYDKDLPGDDANSNPTIEHILPQSYNDDYDWADSFTRDQHKNLKDTWANLVPLSGPLNSSLQTARYSKKRQRYINESMFITPRNLYDRWSEWTPESIIERSAVLSDWAIGRWRHSI